MRAIGAGLHLLEAAAPSNVYLIEGGFGLTMVDAGPYPSADGLAAELRASGFSLDDLRQLIITHAHADSFGGACRLLELRTVEVLAHPKDIPALLGRQPLPPDGDGWRGSVARAVRSLFQRPRPLPRVSPLAAGAAVRSLASWQVLHTPGHTPGSLSLYDPARKALLCGGAFRPAAAGLAWGAADPSDPEARRSLESLAGLACETLCCGRGPVVSAGAGRQIRALAGSLP